VLDAERGSVWLYGRCDERAGSGGRDGHPADPCHRHRSGGACARERQIINVPDCYADPRTVRVDKASAIEPLHADVATCRPQGRAGWCHTVLNKRDASRRVRRSAATALAAQWPSRCGVMTGALIEGEKMTGAEMARVVQMSTLPTSMPAVPSYGVRSIPRT
jgi:hypothetical protein